MRAIAVLAEGELEPGAVAELEWMALDLFVEGEHDACLYHGAPRRCLGPLSEIAMPMHRPEVALGATTVIVVGNDMPRGDLGKLLRVCGTRHIAIHQVSGGGALANPELGQLYRSKAPVYGMAPYLSQSDPKTDWRSATIRELKLGTASKLQITRLAEELAQYIINVPALFGRQYIVPMPRRTPKVPSDLVSLARAIARRTGQEVLEDWLVRVSSPADGRLSRGRMRHGIRAHAASMRVAGLTNYALDALLLDNVITEGGTLMGAQEAIYRDTKARVPGLAVLYSLPLEPSVQAATEP